MITVSKGLSPPVLAQEWMNDLGARPGMSIKVCNYSRTFFQKSRID